MFSSGLDALLGHVIRIEEQKKQIIALLANRHKLPSVALHNIPENQLVSLPLQSDDDIQKLDEYLSNSDYMNLLVSSCNVISKFVLTKEISVRVCLHLVGETVWAQPTND